MAIGIGLEQRQTLGLRMTPQLRQAIKLLQYTRQELVEHITAELQENPAIEVVDAHEAVSSEEHAAMERLAQVAAEDAESRNEPASDEVYERILESRLEGPPREPGASGTIYDDLPPIETNATYSETLAEHLTWQLHMSREPEDLMEPVETLIGNLDPRGYLRSSLEEALPDLPEHARSEAIEVLQSLDPVGVGARDLAECLALQVRQLWPGDDDFEAIVSHHLKDIESRCYGRIAAKLGIQEEDVIEYHRMIRTLDPHPGRRYDSSRTDYIEPELRVRKVDGQWRVFLNREGVPELRISPTLLRQAQNDLHGEAKKWVLDRVRRGEHLLDAISKRRKTIVGVMEAIVEFQQRFFEEGPEALRPLTLQQVAEQVRKGDELPGEPPRGVHMSTVSRATSNKYVDTPHGIFELKYFFSSSLASGSEEGASARSIKERIRMLVEDEDKKRPLSDQKLADLLGVDGTRVARRTVAKYREELGILSSSKRKRVF